jgi:hypothetical protein
MPRAREASTQRRPPSTSVPSRWSRECLSPLVDTPTPARPCSVRGRGKRLPLMSISSEGSRCGRLGTVGQTVCVWTVRCLRSRRLTLAPHSRYAVASRRPRYSRAAAGMQSEPRGAPASRRAARESGSRSRSRTGWWLARSLHPARCRRRRGAAPPSNPRAGVVHPNDSDGHAGKLAISPCSGSRR